jgi:hypothetical protein
MEAGSRTDKIRSGVSVKESASHPRQRDHNDVGRFARHGTWQSLRNLGCTRDGRLCEAAVRQMLVLQTNVDDLNKSDSDV